MSYVTDYLEQLDDDNRRALERIRTLVHEIIPDVEETKSYGIPTYKYKGTYLVAFAKNKSFLSLYPGSEVLETHEAELKGFAHSKGTISFTPDTELSDAVLRAIITDRKRDIDQKK